MTQNEPAPSPPRGILLIRHGESTANAGHPTQNPADIPLSPLGQEQALKLAGQPLEPDSIIISPYLRTRQTAEPLCKIRPHIPVETWPVHEFTYLAPAQYTNTTEDDRREPAAQYWALSDPTFRHGPGAETFAEFISRIDALIHRLRALPSPHLCIFTHSFFICGLLWRQQQPDTPVTPTFMHAYDHFRRDQNIPHALPIPYAP